MQHLLPITLPDMPVPSARLSRLFLTCQNRVAEILQPVGRKQGVTMLSMSSGHSGYVVPGSQQGSQIGNVILRTSSDLAKCEKQEIELIIRSCLADVSAIEGAEWAGWFLLTDSGMLTEVFHSAPAS